MPHFRFKAYDSAGRLEQGELEADSREAALDAITRSGKFPLDLGPVTGPSQAATPWWRRELTGGRALPLATLAVFAREFATLLKADLAIDEVLRVVALQPRIGGRARKLVEAVLERVIGGAALSEALAAQDGAFPQHFWRLVRAGELSSTLPQVLDELAGFLEQSSRLRSQVVTAMIYPMVLLVAAAITVGVIVTVMVPAILPLFQDAGVAPPLLISVLVFVERMLIGHWPIALAALACLAGGAIWMSKNEPAMEARDRAMLRLPVVGGLMRRGSTARFARTLATLTRNGVPMLESLRVTAGVMGNRAFVAAIRNAETEMNQGGVLLAPLERSGLFPDLALRMVALGEQTGQLATMLTRVADIYEHDLQQQLQRVLGIATPAITVVIGVFVGALILSVMSAMLGLNETVLR